MQVGRKRTVHKNLPRGLYCKRGRYYYGRNQEYLADNLPDAMVAYGQRESLRLKGDKPFTFGQLAGLYKLKVIPTKAPRTQADNLKELNELLPTFGNAPLDSFEPSFVRGYLDSRSAKIRANREVALLSAIWNWGIDQGHHKLQNPCRGVRRHKERRRDRYPEHWEYAAVWSAASIPERDAMDILYLTGQRPGDVLKARLTEFRDVWRCRQGKTGKVVPVAVEGALKLVVEQIKARQYPGVVSLSLIRDESGQPLTYSALVQRFSETCKRAGVKFQLRDLRAKHGTDRAIREGILAARDALGHSTVTMTEGYVRARGGAVIGELRTDLAELRTADKKTGAD